MQTNYEKIIIVGQGLCGTFLSMYLHLAGKEIVVYNLPKKNSSSIVTSGVINPVTGRRIVRTWMIEEIMPFAVNAYQKVEQLLQTSIIKQCNILDFHPTPQMKIAFDDRINEEPFLQKPSNQNQWNEYLNYHFGFGEINPCWQIDIQNLLQSWREYLLTNRLLKEEYFSEEQINLHKNNLVIYCDGADNTTNSYFKLLPYALNKGEALIAEINDLPRKNIYKQTCAIVPYKKDLWWIGSNYEWNFENDLPSNHFREDMEARLKSFLKIPYKIVEHIAAIRPANIERRPFIGFHPIHQNIGILNGMGTKGCSLAPYFAHQFSNYIVQGTAIHSMADIKRFSGILSKN
ncbi:MAG: FAD-binding oxidoreductase [Chitinophagaceae bacterium]|nr:FAD-binding oxidoreductase [Chitinophagaceae bacterium]